MHWKNPFRPAVGHPAGKDCVVPPQDDYTAPPGSPPAKPKYADAACQPAAAAAATAAAADDDDNYVAPPPGPPPLCQAPAWAAAVPDTALLPPPPDLFNGYDESPATNASKAEAEAGEAWCREHALYAPAPAPDAATAARRAAHLVRLIPPPSLNRRSRSAVSWDWNAASGSCQVKTPRGTGDALFFGHPALYLVAADSPLLPGPMPKTTVVYYEVVVGTELHEAHGADGQSSLALGYVALPYPTFRQPGWHRGSLAVHGDDGNRYVNDMWGGKDFTTPFRRGQTVGLGMEFKLGADGRVEAGVFFTRDGLLEANWDVNEETDLKEDGSVEGLQGYHDLNAAVGTFGRVSFEVVFDPARWKYRPVGIA